MKSWDEYEKEAGVTKYADNPWSLCGEFKLQRAFSA
jgi:hypothetical protein